MCCTLLLWSCGEPNPEIVKAAKSKSPKKLEDLLDKGGDPNFTWGPNKNSLLHLACQRSNLRIIKLLIERSADLNVRNSKGETPWDLIWSEHRMKIPKTALAALGALLEAGYKPEMKPGEDGKSYLHIIAKRCDNDLMIKILVEKHGAQLEAVDDNGWSECRGHREDLLPLRSW